MKTTITILAYNHERYIRESLASALVQSRAADEIIVIDDASPDGTAGIIEKFIAEHPDRTIRFVRNERNLGVTGSFTKAISMASGDILISMAGVRQFRRRCGWSAIPTAAQRYPITPASRPGLCWMG